MFTIRIYLLIKKVDLYHDISVDKSRRQLGILKRDQNSRKRLVNISTELTVEAVRLVGDYLEREHTPDYVDFSIKIFLIDRNKCLFSAFF